MQRDDMPKPTEDTDALAEFSDSAPALLIPAAPRVPPDPAQYVPRQAERTALSIKGHLQFAGKSVACDTEDFSPAGLRVVSEALLSSGTPLSLQFAFGGTCYLTVAGQVVMSRAIADRSPVVFATGIKFAGIRDWEQIILLSAIQQLRDTITNHEQPLLTITVTEDALSQEVAAIATEVTAKPAEPAPSPARDLRPSEIRPALLPDVPLYPLLINGKDVDTERYQYYGYFEKMITDPKGLLRIFKQIQRGQVPADYREFIAARYCVNQKSTNAEAVKAAHDASQEFRSFPLDKRVKIARDIYDLLLVHERRLLDLMIAEGHPCQLAEWEFSGMKEVYRARSLRFYKRNLLKQIGRAGREILYWSRKPDGVVCVSPPRNAPCSSSIIAGFALLAGNAVVVKPPLRTPISTLFLWRQVVQEALNANGAPPGTLNLVLGNSEIIIEEWITSPYVNDILFIGDTRKGLSIGLRAFQNGKKPILELSGNDMMFVWNDAPLDESTDSLLDGFLGSTQICMIPKKAFIHEDIYDAFETRFVEKVGTLRVGLPSEPGISLSPVLKIAEFYQFLEDAVTHGARLLCGGTRVNHRGEPDAEGQFITPAVLAVDSVETALTMRCIQEENFFPLIPLVKVTGRHGVTGKGRERSILETMIGIANQNEYGLRISAWVRSIALRKQFMNEIHNSGILRINCRHVGFSPFMASHGGTGKSGGPYGELNYVWQKTTHLQGVTVNRLPQRNP